jgi:ABC-type proline/glycine betaine transport system substrate-binding protein
MGDGADVEELAAQWIEDNRALVDEWIAAGLAAA